MSQAASISAENSNAKDGAAPAERSLMGQLSPFLRPYTARLAFGALAVVVTSYASVQVPLQIGSIVDTIQQTNFDGQRVKLLALLVLCLTGLGGVGRFVTRRLMIGASRYIERDMRIHFFGKLTSLSSTFYDVERTGDVMERASSDIESVRMWLGPGMMHSATTVVFLPYAIYKMVEMSPFLTIAALTPFFILGFGVKFFGDHIYKKSRRVQDQLSEMGAMVQDAFAGVRVVKAFRQEEDQLNQFRDLNGELISRTLALARVQAAFHPFMMLMGSTGVLCAVWLGSYMIINDGITVSGIDFAAITVGNLLSFVLILGTLTWPTIALGWSVSLYQRAKASMVRLERVLAATSFVRDDSENQTSLPESADDEPAVRIDSLTFSYPNPPSIARSKSGKGVQDTAAAKQALHKRREEAQTRRFAAVAATNGSGRDETAEQRLVDEHGEPIVLHDINLELGEGQTLGLVGPIGSGKSTLAKLLARYYPVPPETIFINGRDLVDVPLEDIRRHVGFVFQETFLFSTTIRENIRYGRPDVSDEAVEDACRVASLHADISDFPKGYDTMLGERGINLSGGQKQRAAIARALIYDSPILVLDDALSAVDTETEESILKALRAANRKRTVIIIAHRLSTLRDADQILVLDEGRIVERGKHTELAEGDGLYAELWRHQQLVEAIDSAD